MDGDFESVWRKLGDLAASKREGGWLYRGQDDGALPPLTSVGRPWGRTEAGEPRYFDLRDELEMSLEFAHIAWERYGYASATAIEVLALAQHYGLPTRLLDWSFNLFTAAYFACQDDRTDGAIFIAAVQKKNLAADLDLLSRGLDILDSSIPPIFVRIPALDFRIQQQHGAFSLHSDPWKPWTLDEIDPDHEPPFIIPKEVKPEFRKALGVIDFHAGRLMRDFDRICKDIKTTHCRVV